LRVIRLPLCVSRTRRAAWSSIGYAGSKPFTANESNSEADARNLSRQACSNASGSSNSHGHQVGTLARLNQTK